MSHYHLPPAFIARMESLLREEAAAFFASYGDPPIAGLRLNPAKITLTSLRVETGWDVQPLPWTDHGFVIPPDVRAGRHPLHAAGAYYLQEPSAMAVASVLDAQPGELVLDLAASPGGKATQIATDLAGRGTLVANDVIGSRIKPLGENLERWGAANAVLLNDDSDRLARQFGPIFDAVLLDAPCSGEGMFRKSPIAIREWSLEHVAGCAVRQSRILDSAAALVRPGGRLVYSTCTFAPEENEGQIAIFLDSHPEWELRQIPMQLGFSPGRPDWADGDDQLAHTVRIWPHLASGEGHFIALLVKAGEVDDFVPESTSPQVSRKHQSAWLGFLAETIQPGAAGLELDDSSRLREQSGLLYFAPDYRLPLDGVRVVRPGLPLGMAKPGRFEPAHALALALKPEQVRHRVELSYAESERYLAGEQLSSPGPAGWVLITTGGIGLGWGKRSGAVVKNHYPKGLRRPIS